MFVGRKVGESVGKGLALDNGDVNGRVRLEGGIDVGGMRGV